MDEFQIHNSQKFFTNFFHMGYIKSSQNELRLNLKSDVLKELLVLTRQFRDILAYLADFS